MGSAATRQVRPAPDGTRVRTLDDVLQPDDDELLLVAMIELALIQASDPQHAQQDTGRYLHQLRRKGLPTAGLDELTGLLLTDPGGIGWRMQLGTHLRSVPAARTRVWLSMQSVWGVGDEVVEGRVMRRMDAILDLADFPLSVLDIQCVLSGYVTAIAGAKLGRNTDRALGAAGVAAIVAAGLNGIHLPSSGVNLGLDYIRERIMQVDAQVRTLAELVLAADVAALDSDGQSLAEDLAGCLSEDHHAATVRAGTTHGGSAHTKRLEMMRASRTLIGTALWDAPIA